MKSKLIVAALCASMLGVAFADKAIEMTVSGYDADRATLTGFPVLVRLSSAISGFDYSDIASDYSNLIFTDSVGRELPYEVDTWNTAGESLVWVKANSLTQGTVIVMKYGDGQTRTLSSSAVWSDYVGVWHMAETIAADDAASTLSLDSSGNGQHLEPFAGDWEGNENLGADLTLMTSVAGKLGNGRMNSNYNLRRQGMKTASGDTFNAAGDTFTLSGWFYANGANVRYCERLVSRMGPCLEWTTGWDQATKLAVVVASSETQYTIPSLNEGWVYLTVAYSGTTATIYANGALCGSHTITAVPSSTEPFSLGLQPEKGDSAFSGSYDEVRYDGEARSADWVYADYQTQNSAAFLTYGEAEELADAKATVAPTVQLTTAASEYRLASGAFTISLETAQVFPVQVVYTVSGTAVAGVNYVALPGYVTIPAGETSATVAVTPIMDVTTKDATTLTLAIAAGQYPESHSSATMTIANYNPPLSSFTVEVTGYPSTRADLANFPVLVRLSTALSGFKYNHANSDGSDLYFTDENDTEVYPCEIDTWNPAGESLVWVKLPVLRNGVKFHGHFGELNDRTAAKATTWSSYVGVWHLGEADGVAYDSTANALNATPTASGNGSTAAMVAYDQGAVGKARVNMNTALNYWSNQGAQYLYIPYSDVMDMGNQFVVSGWWRAESFLGCSRPISHKDSWSGLGWEVTLQYEGDGTTQTLYPRGAGGSTHNYGNVYGVMNQQWCHLTFVYNWAKLSVYINGELSLTDAIDNNDNYTYSNIGIAFGCMANGADQSFNGEYDEIRLRAKTGTDSYSDDTQPMADYAWAEYHAVADTSFVTCSAVTVKNLSGFMVMVR